MAATGGNGSTRGGRAVLAVGIVALLVAALAAVLVLRDDNGDPIGPGSSAGAAGGGGGESGGAGDDGFDPTPRHAVQGTARSVIFEGRIVELSSIRLEGVETAMVDGEVLDASGRSIGHGSLEAASAVHLTAPGLTMATAGMRIRPGQPALAAGAGGGSRHLSVAGTGDVQIDATRLTLRGEDGTGEPRTIGGPVTVRPGASGLEVRVEGEQVRWTDVPARLRLAEPASGRATLSWAGGGSIEASGVGPISAGFLGLKAQRLQGEIAQEDGALVLSATASLRQVYADGSPQLRTTGAVVVKEVRGAPSGDRAWFRWAPENRGQFDMAITRIAPANEAGAWVNLALDQLPEMCGGEPCPRHGGDTSGLGKRGSGGFLGIGSRSAQPIDAVILPGTGDESEVSLDIPSGTPAGRHTVSLVLEGNFDPVTVDITVDVG